MKPMRKSGGGSILRTLLATMLIASPLASCATLGSATRYVDTSCEAFEPITYSSRDTPETVAEVRAHNRAFDTICPE